MAIKGPIKYGGLCTKSNTTAFGTAPSGNWMDVPLGQMTVCQDFNLLYGALIPRPKVSQFANALVSATNVSSVTAWSDTANWSQANTIFGLTVTGKLFSAPWTWNASSAITMTDVTGTITFTGNPAISQFATLNNILIGTSGTIAANIPNNANAPFQITAYNGTGAALSGSPPSGVVCRVVNNFLFISRQIASSTTFSRVTWSNISDPQTWTAANFIDFRKNDGDRIVALSSIGTDLYIFKFNSIGRLSTSTLTTSGAVTLGPLETIFTGIGAFSPNCVDNLPDGRIVFLGSDLHLYMLDGFSLTDLSDKPYPELNFQSSLDEFDSSSLNQNRVFLKVYPPHNQIFISSSVSSVQRMYAYDYKEKFFAQWTSVTPICLAVVPAYDFSVPNNGFFNNQGALIEGASGGGIFQLDNNTALFGPGNENGGNITATCTINVPLTGDFYGFLPRSLLLPIGNGTTSFTGVTNGVIVTFGWDGTLLTNASFTMASGTTYPNTLVIPIPMTKEGSTTVRPMSLQIKIQVVNTGPILHPFYLSDELLN